MPTKPKSISDLPENVPLFPLNGALLFPRLQSPLQIFETRYISLVDHILAGNRLVGLIQPENATEESPELRSTPLCKVGSVGYLVHFEEMADQRYMIGLEGVCRFDLKSEIGCDTPFRQGEIDVSRFASDFDQGAQSRAVDRDRFIKTMKNYVEFIDMDIDWEEVERTETPDLVNLGCMLTPQGPSEKQLLLETVQLAERAETLIALVEMEMAQAKSGMTLQ